METAFATNAERSAKSQHARATAVVAVSAATALCTAATPLRLVDTARDFTNADVDDAEVVWAGTAPHMPRGGAGAIQPRAPHCARAPASLAAARLAHSRSPSPSLPVGMCNRL